MRPFRILQRWRPAPNGINGRNTRPDGNAGRIGDKFQHRHQAGTAVAQTLTAVLLVLLVTSSPARRQRQLPLVLIAIAHRLKPAPAVTDKQMGMISATPPTTAEQRITGISIASQRARLRLADNLQQAWSGFSSSTTYRPVTTTPGTAETRYWEKSR